MIRILILCLFTISFVHAQVGEVRSVRFAADGWIMRNGSKLKLNQGMTLETGDNIHTEGSQATLLLYPKIQICLVKGTEFTLTQHLIDENNEKTTSLMDLVKGLIRIQVNRIGDEKVDQKVHAGLATFAVRGTEYEVSLTDKNVELDVIEGEVEVSSPSVKTLEIVKPNQGLILALKDHQFSRRPLKEQVPDSGFLGRDDIRERWEKNKAERLMKKLEHERHNGLKDKKLENVKDKVENMLNRREESDDEQD